VEIGQPGLSGPDRTLNHFQVQAIGQAGPWESSRTITTAVAQQAPRNWEVAWTAAGAINRSIRRNPHFSAKGTMVVVRRYARSIPRVRACTSSDS
jgi:hypothetical protein